jgi:hypothetical protein
MLMFYFKNFIYTIIFNKILFLKISEIHVKFSFQ